MKHEYGDNIAKHYAAYRPALHKVILNRLVHPDEHFKNGIDIGCGTGCSTIALAEYCDKVVGLDLNRAMLDNAVANPKISYVKGEGDDFTDFEQGHFDVASFAGSLSYMKTEKLRSELIRTLSPEGLVLVYDFQIFLHDLMETLEGGYSPQKFKYNFEESLKDWSEFSSEMADTDHIGLNLSKQETAHILLANSYRYQLFQNKFKETDPFNCLVEYVQNQHIEPNVKAKIYFARYRLL